MRRCQTPALPFRSHRCIRSLQWPSSIKPRLVKSRLGLGTVCMGHSLCLLSRSSQGKHQRPGKGTVQWDSLGALPRYHDAALTSATREGQRRFLLMMLGTANQIH